MRKSDACPGGVARYIHDSPRFKRKVDKHVAAEISAALDEISRLADEKKLAKTEVNMRFCMPRFDSYINPLCAIFRLLKPILKSLLDEEADPSSKVQAWAKDVLDNQFSYNKLVSLALAVEVLEVGKDWVHSRDQRKRGTFQSICVSQRLNESFLKDLRVLIVDDPPLALAKGYTKGIARHVIDLLEEQLVLRSATGRGRVAQWPVAWGDRMAPIGNARLLCKWIEQYIKTLFPCASLQAALAPMDLAYVPRLATSQASSASAEHDYLITKFKPLAECRQASLDDAVSGYYRVRSLAEAIRESGVHSVTEYWGKALAERNARKHYPDFIKIALPALAQFAGNGELEGNFSSLGDIRLFQRGCDSDLFRAIAKLRLDGPHPSEFPAALSGDMEAARCKISKWVKEVIGEYVRLFGSLNLTRHENKIQQGVVVDVRKGLSRPKTFSRIRQQLRDRQEQRKRLASVPASSRDRGCIFGAAPSAVEEQSLRDMPTKLLAADAKKKQKFEKLAKDAVQYAERLERDRKPLDEEDKKISRSATVRRRDICNSIVDLSDQLQGGIRCWEEDGICSGFNLRSSRVYEGSEYARESRKESHYAI